MIPALTLPTVENVCNIPSAGGRARSGRLSATSVQATGKIPPTPTPVTKESTTYCQGSCDSPHKPVESE